MSRHSSDSRSRASKKAKAVLLDLKDLKPAEHLKPIPKPEEHIPTDDNMPWWLG